MCVGALKRKSRIVAWRSAGRKTRRSYLTDAQMDAKVRALAIEVIGAQRTEALITVCRSL